MEEAVLSCRGRALAVVMLLLTQCLGISAQTVDALTAGINGQASIRSISLVDDTETQNPAFDAAEECFSLMASYLLPYEDGDLGIAQLTSVFRVRAVAVSLHGEMSGRDDHGSAMFGGGLSHVFGKMVGVGLQCHCVSRKQPLGERARATCLTAGLSLMPEKAWSFGLCVSNMTRSDFPQDTLCGSLPTTVAASLRWRARHGMAMAAEVEKSIGQDMVGKIAVGLYPVGGLYATLGYCSEGSRLSGGLGYDWEFVGVRASVSRHEQLGVSAGVGVVFHVGRSAEDAETVVGR